MAVDYGPWTRNEAVAILACRLTSAGLTVAGSLFIIFSLLLFKRFRKLPSRLIFWMTLMSLITGISNLITPLNSYEAFCWIQGMVMHFSQCATFVWTCNIATNLYLVVVLRYKKPQMLAMEKFYHIASWTVSFVFFLCPLLTLNYGHAGLWCWISDRGFGRYWRFLCFYFPLFLYVIYIVLVYFIIAIHVFRTFRAVSDNTTAKAKRKQARLIRRLALYPIAFVAIWTIPIINRIQNWAEPDNPIFALYLLQAIFAPLQGFVNALIYGLDREVRRRYWNCFCACIGNPESHVDSSNTANTASDAHTRLPDEDYTQCMNCLALVSCCGCCSSDIRS